MCLNPKSHRLPHLNKFLRPPGCFLYTSQSLQTPDLLTCCILSPFLHCMLLSTRCLILASCEISYVVFLICVSGAPWIHHTFLLIPPPLSLYPLGRPRISAADPPTATLYPIFVQCRLFLNEFLPLPALHPPLV